MLFINIVVDVFKVIIGLIVFNYLKELPVFHREALIQEKEHKHKQILQQEAYYRQISGNKMEEVFREWTNLFTDLDKLNALTTQDIMELSQNIFMYGSSETISTFAFYMNHNFNEKAQKELGDLFLHYQVYIFAKILSDLKHDFTGYRIDPVDFIKAKINDYDSYYSEENIKRIKEYIGIKSNNFDLQ